MPITQYMGGSDPRVSGVPEELAVRAVAERLTEATDRRETGLRRVAEQRDIISEKSA